MRENSVKILFILIFSTILAFVSFAQEQTGSIRGTIIDSGGIILPGVEVAASSEAMMGRKSGQPGGVLAEEYIAAKFKVWGLEPAGDREEYFQNFTIEFGSIDLSNFLDYTSVNIHICCFVHFSEGINYFPSFKQNFFR